MNYKYNYKREMESKINEKKNSHKFGAGLDTVSDEELLELIEKMKRNPEDIRRIS